MGLRRKLLVSFSLILAVLLVALYLIASTILMSSFSELEEQNVRQNMARVLDAIEGQLEDLDRSLRDWAAWDETYAFVETGHPGYIAQNLADSSFINLRLNLMVFVRYPDQVFYMRSFDPQSGRPADVPASLAAHLTAGSPLLDLPTADSRVSGLLILPEGPLLVASQPVLTSRQEGPIHGVLIFGRFLGAAEVTRLSRRERLDVNVWPYNDPRLPADYTRVHTALTNAGTVIVQSPGVDAIAGYTMLNDVYGRPALIVRVVMPRDVYHAGQATLNHIFVSLLAIGLVFGEATIIILDRIVISRTTRLSTSVTRIRTSGDLSERMDERGRDEIAHLGHEINQMLGALQRSQQELRQTQLELEERVTQRTAELAQLAEQLQVVNRIARAASSTLQLETLLETVYRELQPLFQSDAFFIALDDPEAAGLDFRLAVDGDIQGPPPWLEIGRQLATRVIGDGRPLLIADYAAEGTELPATAGPLPRTWLIVPMRIAARVVGVIAVQSDRPRAYGEPEQRLLSLIADQVAVAVNNARLYTATQSRAEELALLNELGTALTSQLEFAPIVRAALSRIRRLFQAGAVTLLQADSWSGELRFAQTLAGTEFKESPLHAAVGVGFAGWALQHRQPVLAAHAPGDARFAPAVDQHEACPPQSLMAVPLVTPDQIIGVLEVTSGAAEAFTADHLRTLQGIASMMTVALVNARLYGEIKNLLQEREQFQAQLVHSEKMAALGRLVASISHEINNPLQAIQFCLSLVEEDVVRLSCETSTVEYLATIHTEVERISALVQRMRDFYRPAPQGRQLTDLHAVVDTVLDLCRKQLENHRIAVARAYMLDLPPIYSNPDYLKQVFLNLVLNAIDAMPDGGTLTITTSLGNLPVEEEYSGPRTVGIDFQDTGCGMSPEIQAHLFEPFFTTKEGGSGLGLSISYGIIQSLGGMIQVTSAEGRGSTFRVVLPTE